MFKYLQNKNFNTEVIVEKEIHENEITYYIIRYKNIKRYDYYNNILLAFHIENNCLYIERINGILLKGRQIMNYVDDICRDFNFKHAFLSDNSMLKDTDLFYFSQLCIMKYGSSYYSQFGYYPIIIGNNEVDKENWEDIKNMKISDITEEYLSGKYKRYTQYMSEDKIISQFPPKQLHDVIYSVVEKYGDITVSEISIMLYDIICKVNDMNEDVYILYQLISCFISHGEGGCSVKMKKDY